MLTLPVCTYSPREAQGHRSFTLQLRAAKLYASSQTTKGRRVGSAAFLSFGGALRGAASPPSVFDDVAADPLAADTPRPRRAAPGSGGEAEAETAQPTGAGEVGDMRPPSHTRCPPLPPASSSAHLTLTLALACTPAPLPPGHPTPHPRPPLSLALPSPWASPSAPHPAAGREGRRRGHGDRRVAQLRRPAQPARGHGAP